MPGPDLLDTFDVQDEASKRTCSVCRKQPGAVTTESNHVICSKCIETMYRGACTLTERTGLAFVPLVGGCA